MSQDKRVHDDEAAVPAELPADPSRRFWVGAACAVGGVAGVTATIPLFGTVAPSARAESAGAPVEVDISDLAPGKMRVVVWRGKPVWVVRRDEAQLQGIKTQDKQVADPDSDRPGYTPAFAKNEYRSRKPDLFVCIGLCTHLGCSPTPHFETGPGAGLPPSWAGGFICPCHGSTFDMAGRVYKDKPAPDNLEVPPYRYLSDTRILVGADDDHKA
ncbi:ubiquinol-cytochrome c reductase iron-sulfur subunit [Bordetella avium]|uniref:Ubiquinol-cytochrome c reductase iron-sulfur subunit n=1 Tax=Bordetella avium (strain 197N) TaxID=360910 RepID=Q2KTS1_BORA1|nr:ubiquinol-cytochrome c reductase iron-sulfur subunit [Bordetella avium]RIQ20013.1 ubiquinol-cytochrome c reductase iron-sulfur subunit [Bordetella avium]RIQ34593.1 ubiquinol-cytochrome c reductase iron-sulfur subunit [Bordetella avium]RIQ55773.1 ubiquinol-cytochrome c reductase iron-sulfur subunit [Bordetella avium]RIQ74106.1 ubiquinol-cytochrome c reductase iron-sulfur subunit [Bordetella avium]CAJ50939.1 ubiquinol-cytochrome C reductase iron-sulfur subunit [Bordetella avium 197N]